MNRRDILRDEEWRELVIAEPRLGQLIAEAELTGDGAWPCYERFKRRVSQLVGAHVADELLGTSRAYDLAIRRLTEALGL